MFMLVLVPTIASARARQDVIYLKNGEVVKGEIIWHEYQDFNTMVQIRTEEGNVLTFQMDEVEMISNEGEKGGTKGEKDVGAQWGLRMGMNIYNGLLRVPHVGVVVDVPLYKDNLYLQPGFYYTCKRYRYRYYVEDGCFEIPLLLSGRYTFGIAQLQVNFGPYICIANNWDFGLSVGAGVLLKNHYYIGFQYDFGLIDVVGGSKPRICMISVGYNF